MDASNLPDFLRRAIAALQAFLWPPSTQFTVPVYFDYFAVLTWAISGALVGARRGYDIVGVFAIALVSAVGGGLIRDGVLLHRTPGFLVNGVYIMLVVIATALVAIGARGFVTVPRWLASDKLIEGIDALGVPAYAVVGMQLAQEQGLSIPGVVLVGIVTGVGGGLLRDVLTGQPVRLLLPGQYSGLVLLLACITFVVLTRKLQIGATTAGITTMALFFVTRLLIIRFNWKSEPILRAPTA